MKMVLTNENYFTVSHIGSALEADKKINLALKNYVNVHALAASWSTAKRRPINVRGHGLRSAGGLPLARFAGSFWPVEFGLHALATLVPKRPLGAHTGDPRQKCRGAAAVCRQQPHQGPSRRKQPRQRPTKPRHWAHQRRTQHQIERMGRWPWASFVFGLGTGTSCRRQGGGIRGMAGLIQHHDGGGQRLRQQRLSRTVATMRKPSVYPLPQPPTRASSVASGLLPLPPPDRKLLSTRQTLPPSGYEIRQEPVVFLVLCPTGCHPRLAHQLILKTRPSFVVFRG